MLKVPILVTAAVPSNLLVAAFLLVVVAIVAGVVAMWIVAAELGWMEPLDDDPGGGRAPEGGDAETLVITAPEPAAPATPAAAPSPPAAPAPSPAPAPQAAPVAAAAQAGADQPPMYREEEVDRATSIVADPETETTVPAAGRPRFGWVAAGQTDRGRKRPRNEDHLAVAAEAGLFVVADGMGGYAGGLLAARLCCDVIVEDLLEGSVEPPATSDLPRRAAELVSAIQRANRAIHERSLADPALEGMGTTVVCARFVADEGRLYVGHVGDSRVYRVRDGRIQQLTVDHTMARFGVRGKQASALSRAVGVGPGVHVDVILAEPRPDDVYLLCSDGLTKMVRNPELLRRVLADVTDPEEAATALVRMANDAGGKDNVTVVVVSVGEPGAGAREAREAHPESARMGA